jgi:hypothetical protein
MRMIRGAEAGRRDERDLLTSAKPVATDDERLTIDELQRRMSSSGGRPCDHGRREHDERSCSDMHGRSVTAIAPGEDGTRRAPPAARTVRTD